MTGLDQVRFTTQRLGYVLGSAAKLADAPGDWSTIVRHVAQFRRVEDAWGSRV